MEECNLIIIEDPLAKNKDRENHIKMWFHHISNKDDEMGYPKANYIYNSYFFDANIIHYLRELIDGKITTYSKTYYELLKICYLVSKPVNVIMPAHALWELSKNERHLSFPEASINHNLLIDLIAVVLTCQTLDEDSSTTYDIKFNSQQLDLLLKRYNATNLKDAAENYLAGMHFYEMVKDEKRGLQIKIDIHKRYMEFCYESHMQFIKSSLVVGKVQLFINKLKDNKLPLVFKTLNFCLKTLSDSFSDEASLLKYGSKISAYNAINPKNVLNTATDFLLSDLAYLMNRYVVEGIAYDTVFITGDRVCFTVEDDVSTAMIFSSEKLGQRFDTLGDFEYLNKKDKALVKEYLDKRVPVYL